VTFRAAIALGAAGALAAVAVTAWTLVHARRCRARPGAVRQARLTAVVLLAVALIIQAVALALAIGDVR